MHGIIDFNCLLYCLSCLIKDPFGSVQISGISGKYITCVKSSFQWEIYFLHETFTTYHRHRHVRLRVRIAHRGAHYPARG